MAQLASYPVVRTKKFAQTVGFYEDVFGFIPVYEIDGFARLRHKDADDVFISIIDMNHAFIPAELQNAQGQIMSFATDSFDAIYDSVYYEGLEIVKEPTEIGPGLRHFMVADPNNDIVINIVTPLQLSQKQGQPVCKTEKQEHACSCC